MANHAGACGCVPAWRAEGRAHFCIQAPGKSGVRTKTAARSGYAHGTQCTAKSVTGPMQFGQVIFGDLKIIQAI